WLGRLPVKGDGFVYRGTVNFKVLDVDRRAVTRARIEFPAPDGEKDDGETAVQP
ncbi:MAG: magnesium/cobalt efflux protein, partial [Chloroflexi bacterium]|nr:magnesium/cobalt efflux protein [Chloroflexota bacterium]